MRDKPGWLRGPAGIVDVSPRVTQLHHSRRGQELDPLSITLNLREQRSAQPYFQDQRHLSFVRLVGRARKV
jgi:hypothetical protein